MDFENENDEELTWEEDDAPTWDHTQIEDGESIVEERKITFDGRELTLRRTRWFDEDDYAITLFDKDELYLYDDFLNEGEALAEMFRIENDIAAFV